MSDEEHTTEGQETDADLELEISDDELAAVSGGVGGLKKPVGGLRGVRSTGIRGLGSREDPGNGGLRFGNLTGKG